MEAWRQWLLGLEKHLVHEKRERTYLTPTGLLMEGDFTNYSETGVRAKVVGEMAIFQQLLQTAPIGSSPDPRTETATIAKLSRSDYQCCAQNVMACELLKRGIGNVSSVQDKNQYTKDLLETRHPTGVRRDFAISGQDIHTVFQESSNVCFGS